MIIIVIVIKYCIEYNIYIPSDVGFKKRFSIAFALHHITSHSCSLSLLDIGFVWIGLVSIRFGFALLSTEEKIRMRL